MLWQNGHLSDLRAIRCLLDVDPSWTAGEGRGVICIHSGRQSPVSAPTLEKELPCFLHYSSSLWSEPNLSSFQGVLKPFQIANIFKYVH